MKQICKRFVYASAVSVIATFSILVGTASAQIVVGQTSPTLPSESICEESVPFDEFQTSVQAGTSYVVPTSGVLTSWSTNEGPGSGSLGLKVFRPQGGAYLVVGHDGPRPLTPNSFNTFPASIPVQTGDIIGTAVPGGPAVSCVFFTGLAGDVIGYREGLAGDGQSISPEETYGGGRLNISATLLPPPTIASLSPAEGSIKGGGSVVIAGANFAAVSGVSFGSVPATSFTVNSEGQITAVAPASKTLSQVPVTVTTSAGTATSAQPFAYRGCKVPQLKKKKLKAAKKKLIKANCKLGKVKKLHGATSKTGKVTKQNPKAGKILVPGAKVKVTLG